MVLYRCALSRLCVLIFGVGIYQIFVPPVGTVVLANLHLTLWWGLAMTAIGLIYVIRLLALSAEVDSGSQGICPQFGSFVKSLRAGGCCRVPDP